MSFKPDFFMCYSLHFFRRVLGLSSILLICLTLTPAGFQKTADCIVAVVNEEVITLTDLRIVKAFALFREGAEGSSGLPLSSILDKLIDQKLVIQLSAEKTEAHGQELDAYQKRLMERMGEEKIREIFTEYGLDWSGLREYIREKLLFESLISRKFGQTVVVSLAEIEAYYRNHYLPSEIQKGLEPKPMIEMLHEIESSLRKDKIENQIKGWISNLRRQADIQIRVEDLEEYTRPEKE